MQHFVRRPARHYSLHRGVPPSLNNPQGWFNFADKDSIGSISTYEVIFSLSAQLRPRTWFEERTIRTKVEELWPSNTYSYGDRIARNDFMEGALYNILIDIENECKRRFARRDPRISINPYKNEQSAFEGLRPDDAIAEEDSLYDNENTQEHLNSSFFSISNRSLDTSSSVVLSISNNPSEWFDHFDSERSATLYKEEVIHALFTTTDVLSVTATPEQQIRTSETIHRIWNVFDPDGNGIISRDDFLLPGGLADTLSAAVMENERSCSAVIKVEGTIVRTPSDREGEVNGAIASIPTQIESQSYGMGTIAKIPIHHEGPPPLNKTKIEDWFDYLDSNTTGFLTKVQIINGIHLTLNTHSNNATQQQQNQIHQSIETIWCIFNTSSSSEIIIKYDFLQTDGLGDSLIQFVNDWNKAEDIDTNNTTTMQVHIPRGMLPGDILQIYSPVSNEIVYLNIPEKKEWIIGESVERKLHYFNVIF